MLFGSGRDRILCLSNLSPRDHLYSIALQPADSCRIVVFDKKQEMQHN